jgi:hypothetical protein
VSQGKGFNWQEGVTRVPIHQVVKNRRTSIVSILVPSKLDGTEGRGNVLKVNWRLGYTGCGFSQSLTKRTYAYEVHSSNLVLVVDSGVQVFLVEELVKAKRGSLQQLEVRTVDTFVPEDLVVGNWSSSIVLWSTPLDVDCAASARDKLRILRG